MYLFKVNSYLVGPDRETELTDANVNAAPVRMWSFPVAPSLCIVLVRLSCVAACGHTALLFITSKPPVAGLGHSLRVHSSVGRHFHFLVTVNNGCYEHSFTGFYSNTCFQFFRVCT